MKNDKLYPLYLNYLEDKLNNGKLTKISNHKTLIFLGEISYGIYILQYPVYYLLKYSYGAFGLEMIPIGLRIYILYIVLILFSAFSYLYIEKPLREKIKKLKFR